MEIIELEKIAKIDKAIKDKTLKLEIEDVITGKIKKVSYQNYKILKIMNIFSLF